MVISKAVRALLYSKHLENSVNMTTAGISHFSIALIEKLHLHFAQFNKKFGSDFQKFSSIWEVFFYFLIYYTVQSDNQVCMTEWILGCAHSSHIYRIRGSHTRIKLGINMQIASPHCQHSYYYSWNSCNYRKCWELSNSNILLVLYNNMQEKCISEIG